MSIKKFFAGMAVLLSVSLFVIGCPTEPEDGAVGQQGSAGIIYLDGPRTTLAINTAIESGAPLVFVGVTQSDAGEVTIPAGRNVSLVGTPAYTTYAADGYLIIEADSSVQGDGTLKSGTPGSPSIVAPATVTGVVASERVSLQTEAGAVNTDAGVIAVRDLTISATATESGSYILAATNLATKTILVLGDITVSAAITGTPAISVSGDATVTAAQTTAVAWKIGGDLDAKEVPSVGGAITVRGNAAFAKAVASYAAAIQIGGNATFSDAVTTTTGALDVAGKATFVKALTVGAALNAGSFEAQDAVTLGANLTVTGTADFSKTAGTALTATAADATITAAAITFSGNVAASISGSGDKIIFDGPVAFGGDLTLTAVPATFKGDVSFAETKKIVLTTDASVITLVKGIVLGTPVTGGAPAVYGSVIDTYEAASAGVTLTPADDTKLTFTAARTITQDSSSGEAAHGITIGGVAGLPAGATYTVASGENKVGTLTLDTGAELSLASGALLPDGNELSDPAQSKLVLTGAAGENGALLKGAGKVVAGATTISGGTGSWQAVDAGGNVEITANAITGTSTDAAFVAAANAGAITVGDHTVASTTFTVTSLAVNIVAGGTIAIPYPVSGTGNVFKLANSGASLKGLKITGTAGTTITGITNATVVGKSTVGTSGSAVAGNFIAGADGSTAATITGAEDSDDASVTNATAISSS